MKNTLRYNPPPEWNVNINCNLQYFGIIDLCKYIVPYFHNKKNITMLEIGSYKGESTSIFASTGLFSKITCLEPFDGNEEALDVFNEDWSRVKKEFWTNTRHWDNINLIQDFSYNVVNEFEDNYFDFIYIDASHKYEDIKSDIDMYLPKCKVIISGHDYGDQHPGVKKAVDELLGQPNGVFADGSWIKILS